MDAEKASDPLQEDEIAPFPVRRLGGLPITVVSRSESADAFIARAVSARGKAKRPFYSTSANGQVLSMCGIDEALCAEFLKADEILADGMPMVFYSKWAKGLSLPERVATTDLVHDVAENAEEHDISFFLLGADEDANEKAQKNLERLYPKLTIAGRRNGYFREEEEADVVAQINAVRPDILWVAMGVPREQVFLSRNLNKLDQVGVVKTAGGLFDFLSNRRSRAPGWVQMLGLEWAYRMALEPRRLGMRYLKTNPHAIKLLLTRS